MGAPLTLIWAQTTGGVIGGEGEIPWHIPGEQRRFKELTTGGTVIMGRKTWDSLPERVRPMPGRANIVITRQRGFEARGAVVVHSVEAALAAADPALRAWGIGGGEVYRQLMPAAEALEVTEVDLEASGDAYAPEIGPEWRVDAREPRDGWLQSPAGLRYRFVRYLRG